MNIKISAIIPACRQAGVFQLSVIICGKKGVGA